VFDFLFAQLAQHAQTVAARQHDVEHDGINDAPVASSNALTPSWDTSTAKLSA